MSKLVILSDTYPPDLCGVADYVACIARQLASSYEVHIITRKTNHVEEFRDGSITIYPILSGKAYIFKAIRRIQHIQPAIVDVQLSYSSASQLHKKNLLTLINPLLLRLMTRPAKLCLTIHELTTYLSDQPSCFHRLYRTFRDYGQTRFYDHYFCVSPDYLDYLKKARRKTFLPSFSNIPTLRSHNLVNTKNFIFFGTIGFSKNIDCLCRLFCQLYQSDPEMHLYFVGGIVPGYEDRFIELTQALPPASWSNLGRLEIQEMGRILEQCSYAIFPFPVTDKNASVLAMLVNSLVVIGICQSLPFYTGQGNNFYGLADMTVPSIQAIISTTFGKRTHYPSNKALTTRHLEQRQAIYQQLLTG